MSEESISPVPLGLVKLIDVENASIKKHYVMFRGNAFRKFTLHLAIDNMQVTIAGSNVPRTSGVGGFIDLTSLFTTSSSFTSDTMLMQTTGIKMLFWRICYLPTNAVNKLQAYLYQYDEDKD